MTNSFENSHLIENWSYDHFKTFLLLYAAYSDYEYSEIEKEYISGNVSGQIFTEVDQVFLQLGEFEQLQIILNLKERFIKSENDKSIIIEQLISLFKIDGEFSRPEKNLQNFLTRIFESDLNS